MIRKLCLTLFLMATPALALAAGATKIGVLDLQAVVLTSEAGKGGMAELEGNKEYAALIKSVEKSEQTLKSLDEELKGKGLTWAEDKKEKQRTKMNEVAQERQQTLMTLNRARESVFMQMLSAMEPAIGAVLEEVMKAEGIDMIVDSKSVIHKMPTADVTPMVVEKLNKVATRAAKSTTKK